MRRMIVLLVAITAMVVVYAGTALAEAPPDTLDAHYLDVNDPSYSGFNERYKQGQTFTVENAGHLTKVEVTVSRSFETTSDLKMEIVSVNAASGLPTDNVLASASLPASEIVTYGGGAMETFTFDNPAVVRAGKQYAFVLHGNTTTYSFSLAMDSYNGLSPGYPGGQGYWLYNDYTLLQEIPDHIFAVYVAPGDFPDVTSPVLSLPEDITKEAEGPNGATVSWPSPTATDDVDDSVTVDCDKASGDTFPLGTTTVTCSATDAAGNTASDSFDVTVQDPTPPTLSVSHTPDGTNGWNKTSPVTLSVSASDSGSGLAGAAPACTEGSTALTLTASPTAGNWTASVSGEGIHDVSCSVSDNANNSTNASDTVWIDTTAPSISDLGPTTQPNAAGWYKTDVTNRFKASDSGSGLNGACQTAFPANAAGNNVQSKTTSGEGSSLKVTSASCADVAGNKALGIDSATFKIDKTAPKVSAATPTGTGIGRGTNVVATFSERMDPASITNSTFKLFRCTSSTTCTTQLTKVTLSKSTDGLRATINPYGTSSTLLAANTKYKAVVTTGTQDVAGNALDQDRTTTGNQQKSWTFTTKG